MFQIFPICSCVGCTNHHSGSVTDLEIFRVIKTFHKEASRKVIQNLSFPDFGLLLDFQGDYWAILAD